MTTPFTRTVPATTRSVQELEDALEHWARSNDLGPRDVFRLNLVLDELVTNIVHHGYRDAGGDVDVRVALGDGDLVVTLRDRARPHDPFSAAAPDLTGGLEDRSMGGLGVHFVRSVAREFTYRRDGDANEVIVRLPRAAG